MPAKPAKKPAEKEKEKRAAEEDNKDDDGEEGKEIEDLRNANVVTKYKAAADIVNKALALVIKEAVVDAKITDLCQLGDKYITDETAKLYNKGKEKVEKGVGFPTCVSVNQVVGHFSPSKEDETKLQQGDLVKVDLGVHIDGYLAVGAHSFVVGEAVVNDRRADIINACNVSCELAQRLLRPGNKSNLISKMLAQVAQDFKVELVGGIVSHQIERFNIDGEKVVVNKPEPEQKPEIVEFAPNEVYVIDILFTTGEGKVHEVDKQQTTVYKRSVDETYKLKLKASRAIYSEIAKKFPNFPFTLRELESKAPRFGIKECFDHGLVTGYPVLSEKNGELVAHMKFTALILPNQTQRITGVPFEAAKFVSDKSLTDEELKKLLAASASGAASKKKKKKKKVEGAAAEAEGAAGAEEGEEPKNE